MVLDTDPSKRPIQTEIETVRVKRQAQKHTGEEVHHIPFSNTSADVMDARAKAIQENARIAEITILEAVANASGDLDGLDNALGSDLTAPEVAPQEVALLQFDIPTPRPKKKHVPHFTVAKKTKTS